MKFSRLELGEARDLAESVVTLAAAYDAGIFRALLEGPRPPETLAGDLGLDLRATEILLPVLVELGELRENDGVFELTEAGRRRLADPDSPDFAGGGLPLWLRNLRAFTRLPEVLEEGGPLPSEEDEGNETERLSRFMAAMAAAPEARVQRLVDLCLDRVPHARRMLDLGGGPGHMARAFVEQGVESVLMDMPETVAFVAEEYGLADVDGLRLVGGDFHEDPLPEGPFDLVLMSNILHIYGPRRNRELVERVGGITAPGGAGAVVEFVRGPSSRAARFALVMLLRTEDGNSYSLEEIQGWLQGGGFGEIRMDPLDEDRQLVTGIRV